MKEIDEKTLAELEFDEEWGITETELDEKFNEAVRLAKELARIKKVPTCEYDAEKGKSYLLYPDGHREY